MVEADLEALSAARYQSDWYRRDVEIVARELVGSVLVHRKRAGVIVETEAYGGPDDLASHARFGPTKRTSVMFGPGGVSYVYLCYGIHEMMNIVTGVEGQGQAVLIRAIAPHAGLPDDDSVGRGPGKVTIALGIDRRHDGRDLTKGSLYVAPGVTPTAIATGPRVGVDYAGAWAAHPARFWWQGHAAVSRQPAKRQLAGRNVSTRRKR